MDEVVIDYDLSLGTDLKCLTKKHDNFKHYSVLPGLLLRQVDREYEAGMLTATPRRSALFMAADIYELHASAWKMSHLLSQSFVRTTES
jgi:hypothetical protein